MKMINNLIKFNIIASMKTYNRFSFIFVVSRLLISVYSISVVIHKKYSIINQKSSMTLFINGIH